jgi:hypothetical protein
VGLQQGFGLGGMSFGNHFAKQQFWLAYVPHGSTASVWARADHFRTRSPLLVSIKFVSSPSVVEFTEFRITFASFPGALAFGSNCDMAAGSRHFRSPPSKQT